MKKGGNLKRRTPMQSRGGHQIDASVRADVQRRDRGCTGQRLPGRCRGGIEVHHLTNRSQGRDDSLENLICLCSAHHAWVTENPTSAQRRGFSIPGWVHDDPDLWVAVSDWAWQQRYTGEPGTPPWAGLTNGGM